jgi:hypothetical protein
MVFPANYLREVCHTGEKTILVTRVKVPNSGVIADGGDGGGTADTAELGPAAAHAVDAAHAAQPDDQVRI